MSKMLKVFYSLMVAVVLTGCSATIDYRGKLPEPEQIAQLKIGQSEEEVITLIGSPTNTSLYGPKNWYYVSKKTAKTSFFDPTTLEEKVLIITFNDQGKVTNISETTPDGKVINPLRHKTQAVGQDQTVLQQVFGNFGRHAKKAESGQK